MEVTHNTTPVSDYDFTVPPGRIAQRPRPFGDQKLLVFEKKTGTITHRLFTDLPTILTSGDLLVLNDTKVVPAQVRSLDLDVSVLFLHPTACPGTDDLMVILSTGLEDGTVIGFPAGASLTIMSLVGGDPPVHRARLYLPGGSSSEDFVRWLEANGEMPLPPYVERTPDASDLVDYQTSLAMHPGAVAAPTAGLHFHSELLTALKTIGVEVVTVTLHVG